MTAAWLIPSLLAALGLYLASAHQRLWPRGRSHARMLRVAAGCGIAVATTIAVMALGLWPGVFAALSALMFALVLLPYADAWRQGRKDVRGEHRHVG